MRKKVKKFGEHYNWIVVKTQPYVWNCSLWQGVTNVHEPTHVLLHPPRHHHIPRLHLLLRQACPGHHLAQRINPLCQRHPCYLENEGIWARCHLSAGSYASRRNTGARSINMIIIINPILVITTMIMIIYSQGIFFIIPCVDVYEKIDMRTQLFCVPPQEVRSDGLR